MKIPNGFFGNGPGRDEQNTRDQDAYLRNRSKCCIISLSFFRKVDVNGLRFKMYIYDCLCHPDHAIFHNFLIHWNFFYG